MTAASIQTAAAKLSGYCASAQVGEDAGVAQWAAETEPFRFFHLMDPVLGAVRGIGPTLFAYMRMLSGADGIKPDGRVHKAVLQLGIPVPRDAPITLLAVAEALAQELQVSRLFLDQLLWYT